jgi:hypothetical protein
LRRYNSSLNKLTHNFKMLDGRPVQPAKPEEFQISGSSGEENKFFFQARDKFGNILKQSGLTLKVGWCKLKPALKAPGFCS